MQQSIEFFDCTTIDSESLVIYVLGYQSEEHIEDAMCRCL